MRGVDDRDLRALTDRGRRGGGGGVGGQREEGDHQLVPQQEGQHQAEGPGGQGQEGGEGEEYIGGERRGGVPQQYEPLSLHLSNRTGSAAGPDLTRLTAISSLSSSTQNGEFLRNLN